MSTLPPNWKIVIICFMDFQTTWLTSNRLSRMPLQELLLSQRKLFILSPVLRKLLWLRNEKMESFQSTPVSLQRSERFDLASAKIKLRILCSMMEFLSNLIGQWMSKWSKMLAENHGCIVCLFPIGHKYKETSLLLEERKISIVHDISVRHIIQSNLVLYGIIKSYPASFTS